jgi:hypothetical protein
MRFVERAVTRPMHCAALPQLGAGHKDGYLDFGSELPGFDNHVYLSVVAVREACNFLGWPTPESHAELQAALDAANRELEDTKQQLEEADKELGAVYVLKSRDWTPAKKPGRPKKIEEEVA